MFGRPYTVCLRLQYNLKVGNTFLAKTEGTKSIKEKISKYIYIKFMKSHHKEEENTREDVSHIYSTNNQHLESKKNYGSSRKKKPSRKMSKMYDNRHF